MTTNPEIGATVLAAGIRTNVHDTGFDPGGGTVLLIHGSGPGVSAWANWRLTIPALTPHFRVVAPDIVGFSYTERPIDAYDLDTWTLHVTGVLDALGIDPAARAAGTPPKPLLGMYDRQRHAASFPRAPAGLQSVAMVPLLLISTKVMMAIRISQFCGWA